MPNLLAQVVLYSWPLVTWLLFRKLKREQAMVATILIGYLFIPERVGFDPPLLPAINKGLLPAICAAVAMWWLERRDAHTAQRQARKDDAVVTAAQITPRVSGKRTPSARHHGSRLTFVIPLIVGTMMVGQVLTWVSNQEPIYFGARVLPGIAPYDIGMMWSTLLCTLLPLWLGVRYLRSREAMIDVLKVFAWCGLAYSFLVFWESRMSPQLNKDLYGFFAHNWRQHLRDGFRPIVFLAHGLRVGIFLAMAALAAAALARANVDGKRWRWLGLALWITLSLSISRNLGATMIAFGLLPVMLLFPLRLRYLLGVVIAATVLIYPLARGGGVIPAQRIVDAVSTIDVARAGSLEFRLNMEDALLGRANEKPIFGWGGWGRWLTFDADTGKKDSVPDGIWVITIGENGWVGYLGTFGLLCLPLIIAGLRYKRYEFGAVEAGLVIVICANLIDLIPNSSLLPPLWLIAGTVWGRLAQASMKPIEAPVTGTRLTSPAPVRAAATPRGQSAKTAPLNT